MDNSTTIEQVAATIAHEVKNPISLVLANIELLESYDRTEKNKKSYLVMKRELNKVMNIVVDFIQLSKPARNNYEEMDLNDMLFNIIDSCKDISHSKLEFTFSCNSGNVKLCADKSKLSRVFFNIYKNSMEAISNQGTISTYINKQDSYVEIKISDDGIGLSNEVKEKLATPFFTTKESGSGLGVFISKSIIQEHNGSFEITGDENKGCIVTIILPLSA